MNVLDSFSLHLRVPSGPVTGYTLHEPPPGKVTRYSDINHFRFKTTPTHWGLSPVPLTLGSVGGVRASVEDLKSIHSSVFTLSRADVYREAGTILYWCSLDPSA